MTYRDPGGDAFVCIRLHRQNLATTRIAMQSGATLTNPFQETFAMTRFLVSLPILALLATGPARADDVTDALQNAIDAYTEGDVAYAMSELDYAKQLLAAMETDALVALLPEAPEGWTREIDTEMGAGLAMMGGGTGAQADYAGDDGSFSISIMADNPMVSAMAAAIGGGSTCGRFAKNRSVSPGTERAPPAVDVATRVSAAFFDRSFASRTRTDQVHRACEACTSRG